MLEELMPKMKHPRILIADDHDVVRQGIRSIITRFRPDWEICGEVTDGAAAIAAVQNLIPDVIILDITMPVMSGVEAASRISKLGLPTRILIFTMHESNRMIADVSQAGAHGCVLKSEASRDLLIALETLMNGGTFFGPQDHADPGPSKKADPTGGTSLCEIIFAVD